jgi:hypothetical protein
LDSQELQVLKVELGQLDFKVSQDQLAHKVRQAAQVQLVQKEEQAQQELQVQKVELGQLVYKDSRALLVSLV